MAEKGDSQLDLKKRARRRLVGAGTLALLAAIVLPMVMDQEPRPLKGEVKIRVPGQERAPRPQEAAPVAAPLPAEAAQQAVSAPAAPVAPVTSIQSAKPAAVAPLPVAPLATINPPTPAKPAPAAKAPAKPADKPAEKPTPHVAEKSPEKTVAKPEKPVPEKAKQPPKAVALSDQARAEALLNGADPDTLKPAAKAAEEKHAGPKTVQVGVYSEPDRVSRLRVKITELGYKTAIETVHTPKGDKIRLRAGPFPSREAAEKAQARLKTIGLNGAVSG